MKYIKNECNNDKLNELIKQAKNGKDCISDIAKMLYPLFLSLAKKVEILNHGYENGNLYQRNDLIGIAFEKLPRYIEKFDMNRGICFSTYIYLPIYGYMNKEYRKLYDMNKRNLSNKKYNLDHHQVKGIDYNNNSEYFFEDIKFSNNQASEEEENIILNMVLFDMFLKYKDYSELYKNLFQHYLLYSKKNLFQVYENNEYLNKEIRKKVLRKASIDFNEILRIHEIKVIGIGYGKKITDYFRKSEKGKTIFESYIHNNKT